MKKVKPYIPQKLPPKGINWRKLIPLIGAAHDAIGRYDGLLQNLMNPEILLAPLTTNEAVLSSRIEGTQASLEDVFEHEVGLDEEKSDSIKRDIQEIINYRIVLISAEDELNKRELSLSFIKGLHKILLSSVRGKNKNPGEFRKEQNWIGLPGTPITKARFIPPSPLLIQEYMENWEQFLHSDRFEDKLVQLSILHAQFEIVHPFNDGNGRTGRLLIPLFLYNKKILSRPMFYLSEYLEAHRDEYYNKLLLITQKNDWQGWVEFFLKALIVQAETNTTKANQILQLYERLKEKFITATNSKFAVPLLDAFFQRPMIDSASLMAKAGINNRVTLNALLKKIEEEKLIVVLYRGKGRKPSVYALPELINIVEGRRIF